MLIAGEAYTGGLLFELLGLPEGDQVGRQLVLLQVQLDDLVGNLGLDRLPEEIVGLSLSSDGLQLLALEFLLHFVLEDEVTHSCALLNLPLNRFFHPIVRFSHEVFHCRELPFLKGRRWHGHTL